MSLHIQVKFTKETNFVLSCLLLLHTYRYPSEMRSSLKGKNLLHLGANSFLSEKTPFFSEGRQNDFDRIASHENLLIS